MSPDFEVQRADDALESFRLCDHRSNAVATVAPARGGMVTRFSVDGEEVLFLDETTLRDPAKNVRGGVPILFPIAGPLAGDRWRDGDRMLTMKQHGFARLLPWTVLGQAVAETAGATLTLQLCDDETTRAQYPFRFELIFSYTVRGRTLTINQRFSNRDQRAMPIQPGLHPYFLVADADKRRTRIPTAATSAYDNRTRQMRRLDGPVDLTGEEVDLHLSDHGSTQATLVRPPLRDVQLTFGADQRLLVVWTQRGRDFVCVEPWTARANALNDGQALMVAPGASHETFLSIALR